MALAAPVRQSHGRIDFLMEVCVGMPARRPAPRAVLLRKRRRKDGRPTESTPARREFFHLIVASDIEEIQQEESAIGQKPASEREAALLLAAYVTKSAKLTDADLRPDV